AHVTLVARSRDAIEDAALALCHRGGAAEMLQLDVRDLGAVNAALAGREPFDVLVNNAGTNRPASFTDVTVEDFDTVMSLNLRAAFFVAQGVVRGMTATGRGGTIINISSQLGHVGGLARSVYTASKHAIEGLTKAMAIELAPHRIRVNTLAPTYIETPMTRSYFENETFRNEALSKIALGRIGQPGDLTGAIVFLASDASALMTGSSLVIDGGWTAA